jgi:hypothetical protein
MHSRQGEGGGGGMTGEQVDCERGPRTRLPFNPCKACKLGKVLVPAMLHDKVAKEGMVAAKLRHAGTGGGPNKFIPPPPPLLIYCHGDKELI